jgi:hypothetical protein
MSTVNETQCIRLSIEELQKHWYVLQSSGVHNFYVTEMFPRHGAKTFCVCDLTMDLDNELATCYDCKGALLDNYSGLCMFFRKHLTKIDIIPNVVEVLEFDGYGTVLIRITK